MMYAVPGLRILSKVHQTSLMLALVCSGRAVQTEPVAVQPNKWMFEIPAQVQHFAVFFTQPPPPGYGAAIYHHHNNGAEWSLLGCLTAEKPSAIYRLSGAFEYPTRLGIDIEPVMALPQSSASSATALSLIPASNTSGVAKVLESLYNFVMSFTGDPTNPNQAIPVKLFNEWYASMMKRHGCA